MSGALLAGLKRAARRIVNGALAPVGFEVQRKAALPGAHDLHCRWINKARPVIFDIGANVGQTLELYRELSPQSTIVAFEPFPEAFATLKSRHGAHPANHLHNVAVSDFDGTVRFYLNEFNPTNSLLPLTETANDGWGSSPYVSAGHIAVESVTLDSFCRNKGIYPDILKADVQGGELAILRGAEETLTRATVVYLEMLLTPTYVGQGSPPEILALLYDAGFALRGVHGLVPSHDFKLLQADLSFVRA